MKQPTVRVSLAFLHLTVLLFIAFGENVVTMLTGNVNFTATFPSLVDVTAALTALQQAQQAAMDGSRMAIAARNQCWDDLLGLMRPLASWVQAHCQNSLSILATSGFNAIRNSRLPIGPLVPPQTPVLKQGAATGVLKANTRRMRGAYTYCWRIALASTPAVYLQTVMSPSVKRSFTTLTAGQIYSADVCGIGTAGEGAYSSPITKMVT